MMKFVASSPQVIAFASVVLQATTTSNVAALKFKVVLTSEDNKVDETKSFAGLDGAGAGAETDDSSDEQSISSSSSSSSPGSRRPSPHPTVEQHKWLTHAEDSASEDSNKIVHYIDNLPRGVHEVTPTRTPFDNPYTLTNSISFPVALVTEKNLNMCNVISYSNSVLLRKMIEEHAKKRIKLDYVDELQKIILRKIKGVLVGLDAREPLNSIFRKRLVHIASKASNEMSSGAASARENLNSEFSDAIKEALAPGNNNKIYSEFADANENKLGLEYNGSHIELHMNWYLTTLDFMIRLTQVVPDERLSEVFDKIILDDKIMLKDLLTPIERGALVERQKLRGLGAVSGANNGALSSIRELVSRVSLRSK